MTRPKDRHPIPFRMIRLGELCSLIQLIDLTHWQEMILRNAPLGSAPTDPIDGVGLNPYLTTFHERAIERSSRPAACALTLACRKLACAIDLPTAHDLYAPAPLLRRVAVDRSRPLVLSAPPC